MAKCPALMIIFFSSLLLSFQNLKFVSCQQCSGSLFNASSSSYDENRHNLFSSLASKVAASGGFSNASLGKIPDRVYAIVLCARGYEQQACTNCVNKTARNLENQCSFLMDSFGWESDENDKVSCLVRSSNQSTLGKLVLTPVVDYPSQERIRQSNNMTLFEQEWEAMVNRTLKAAAEADNSSKQKYFSAQKAEFTEIPDVNMLMQCTPDLTSKDCNKCLEESVTYFKRKFRGRQGGVILRPSCFFRWDLFEFHGAFNNATRVPAPPRPQPNPITEKKGRCTRFGGIIAIIVVPTFINLLVFVGLIKWHARKRKSNNTGCTGECSDGGGQYMLRFNLDMIVMATDDFSSENTLGQGGFGTVYKGKLLNGQEIAVKRLRRGSAQGDLEFKNEVSLLTRLQHRNLVKLLGFCDEGDEEILVYEFVPNSSLDHFIFDEVKRALLTWEVRYKIIQGIARGLVYLHEDSQLKIIHRGLKASNILLDAEMNPKVSDFGTARLFNTDETRAETRRIAGTRGYMAPEYLNHGHISAKSDVYGFGVMLLEMISGERNNSIEGGLAAFAWTRWAEGKPETIIDHFMTEDSRQEITKFIQIALLCVQENAAKRPTMSSIIVWLASETVIIPFPTAPAFTISQSQSEEVTILMSNDFTELSAR